MAFGICGAGPVSTWKVHEFVLVRVIACLLYFVCIVWPHAMAPAIASGQKKNKRHRLLVFFVFLLVRMLACLLACLLVVFLFVSFGRTQWLQPLHRTKKKTSDIACLVVCFVFRFFVSLVRLGVPK